MDASEEPAIPTAAAGVERAAGMFLTASSFVFGLTAAFATPDARSRSWWARGTLLVALFALGISTLMTAYAALRIATTREHPQLVQEALLPVVNTLYRAWWMFGLGIIAVVGYTVFAIV